jgi:hypothetical protein
MNKGSGIFCSVVLAARFDFLHHVRKSYKKKSEKYQTTKRNTHDMKSNTKRKWLYGHLETHKMCMILVQRRNGGLKRDRDRETLSKTCAVLNSVWRCLTRTSTGNTHPGNYKKCIHLALKLPHSCEFVGLWNCQAHQYNKFNNIFYKPCKIWGFHGSDYEKWRLLGCYSVWFL